VDNSQIQTMLQNLGERMPASSRLFLVGGTALALLGSPRITIDIDFVGDDVSPTELHQRLMQAAKELKIIVDPVPMERFIPLPTGSADRSIRIGQFGNLEVYVADPYSIALSKLDRGFDTDLEDVVFLVQRGFVDLKELDNIIQASLPRAKEFDIIPADVLARLQIVRDRSK
jgi:hypothetical protein